MRRRIQAWLNLAYRFNRHVLVTLPARALRGGDGDLFRAATAAEGLLPLLPAERALLPRTMRCVHCGLCAFVPPPGPPEPYSAWQEPWTFVGGEARALDRAALAAGTAAMVARAADADAICPTGTAISGAARMITRLAAAAERTEESAP
jgi:hypothetical protein